MNLSFNSHYIRQPQHISMHTHVTSRFAFLPHNKEEFLPLDKPEVGSDARGVGVEGERRRGDALTALGARGEDPDGGQNAVMFIFGKIFIHAFVC